MTAVALVLESQHILVAAPYIGVYACTIDMIEWWVVLLCSRESTVRGVDSRVRSRIEVECMGGTVRVAEVGPMLASHAQGLWRVGFAEREGALAVRARKATV